MNEKWNNIFFMKYRYTSTLMYILAFKFETSKKNKPKALTLFRT